MPSQQKKKSTSFRVHKDIQAAKQLKTPGQLKAVSERLEEAVDALVEETLLKRRKHKMSQRIKALLRQ